MRKTLFFLVLLFLFPPFSYPYRKEAVLLKKADKCRRCLYRSKEKRKYRSFWIRCIKKYRRIYRLYPQSPEAPWALYHAANLYLNLYRYSGRRSDLEKAINLFSWLSERYPKHRLADDAQYKIGWIFFRYKKDYQRAYIELLKVEIRHPKGDMYPKAKFLLDRLALILSRKETEELKRKLRKKVYVKNIRYWSTERYTRVVLDLSRSARYRYRIKDGFPKSLIIYIDNAFVLEKIKKRIKKGPVKEVIAVQRKDKVFVKVLFKRGKSKVFRLYDPFRIVIDVEEKERKVRKGIRKVKRPDKTISLARQLGLNVRRIVIDPGHGGKDPGCIWGRIKEKDITLRISKILAKKLKQRLNCEVYLTRTTDVYLPLEKRTAIANMKKADLFISIHVNAHKNRRLRGIETYFLNMATDERAILVAARENATSEKNMSDLQSIIRDLMLNTKIHESSQLAYEIQKAVVSTLRKYHYRAVDLGVKQGPFYVLVGAQMPSVLIEVGFITNRTERRLLTKRSYQEAIAEGIYQGIKRYIIGIQKVASAY